MPLPSNDWQWHLKHVRAVLRSLRVAGLTANPQKYAIGRVEVRYLGFHLGDRQVRPEIDKTAAKAAYPGTKNKKEVRPFEGLAEYYSSCIPNYSELTSPLTDLTKKEAPDPVQWTELYQQALSKLKAALCQPVHLWRGEQFWNTESWAGRRCTAGSLTGYCVELYFG